jgi:hypothetical protein
MQEYISNVSFICIVNVPKFAYVNGLKPSLSDCLPMDFDIQLLHPGKSRLCSRVHPPFTREQKKSEHHTKPLCWFSCWLSCWFLCWCHVVVVVFIDFVAVLPTPQTPPLTSNALQPSPLPLPPQSPPSSPMPLPSLQPLLLLLPLPLRLAVTIAAWQWRWRWQW